MHILLFIFYCGLCGFGILRIPFFKKSGIRPGFLLTLFGLHVLVGCLHNMIAWRFYPEHGDIWFYYQFSFLERHRLLHDTHLFLYYNSSWDAISHNAITFIQIILNRLSFDNMWINTLLFSFPVFLGNTALYRVYRRQFPGSPLSAATAFLLPSTLFWTACIHREAVLFALLGFVFYWLDKVARGSSSGGRRSVLLAAFAFIAIIFFRFAVALVLIPALVTWLLMLRPPSRRVSWIIAAAAMLVVVLFAGFGSTALLNSLGAEQQSFMALKANSTLFLPTLDGTWTSLLKAIPAALKNGLFEPLPGSPGQRIYQVFALELIGIWALAAAAFAAAALVKRSTVKRNLIERSLIERNLPTPFAFACIVFAFLGMFQIGLIIPFTGAIIRYRSIYLPFLVAPCFYALKNWQPFRTFNTWFSRTFLINY
jgi:hypothetical protein